MIILKSIFRRTFKSIMRNFILACIIIQAISSFRVEINPMMPRGRQLLLLNSSQPKPAPVADHKPKTTIIKNRTPKAKKPIKDKKKQDKKGKGKSKKQNKKVTKTPKKRHVLGKPKHPKSPATNSLTKQITQVGAVNSK